MMHGKKRVENSMFGEKNLVGVQVRYVVSLATVGFFVGLSR